MPKQKARRAVLKRFKITSTGKVLRRAQNYFFCPKRIFLAQAQSEWSYLKNYPQTDPENE